MTDIANDPQDVDTALFGAAQNWLATDVSADSRAQLAELMARARSESRARAELRDSFAADLQFGTSGLRGKMGPGSNRMNRAVVIRVGKGLSDFLLKKLVKPRVVIGNDARHHSRQFAIDTAAVLTAAGVEALLLPDPVPTPVLAYAVRALMADAGVMITASHNPAADNGYKVYLGGDWLPDAERGVQIVSPYDTQIAASIAAAPPATAIARTSSGWTELGCELVDEYIQKIAAPHQMNPALAPIRIVYTPMHGVGAAVALQAFNQAGFNDVLPVPAQQHPDPDFPTVAFPNPEEPNAMDLAIALAKESNADIAIANDPDADRCAAALNDPRSGWRVLSGDELGALLGADIAKTTNEGVLTSSLVSSRLLQKIAAAANLSHIVTLTGFKWMGRVPEFIFAYEESIGYAIRPDVVRDKDGISTALQIAALASKQKAAGGTLIDLLDDLARRHGLYATAQVTKRSNDAAQLLAIMERLRAQPPAKLADSEILEISNLSTGYRGLQATAGIAFHSAANDRVLIRPSGTEPKLKCYLEVVMSVPSDATFDKLTVIRAAAAERLAKIASQLQQYFG